MKRIFLIVMASTIPAVSCWTQQSLASIGCRQRAQVQRHRPAMAAALFGLLALAFQPAFGEDQAPNERTDLYDRPVLAIDPGRHTAAVISQAVDAAGRFAVTGGEDRTVRIWSVADGKLLRTIWIPVGPESVGTIYSVAINPDGSTIAAGGWTENSSGPCPIYLFDRESGNLSAGSVIICQISCFISLSRRMAATSPQR